MLATGTLYVHKRVLAHEHTCIHTYSAAFQEKDCSPESFLSEKRNGGAYSTVTARPCSPAPASETTSTDIKVCFPAGPVQSLSSSVGASPQQLHCILGCRHLWGVSLGHPCPSTAPVTVPSATDKGQYLQSPGCNEGISKGRSSQHQNLTELFCWVIKVTVLLHTWVCFAILPPNSKWICWVILRKRKRWPIFRPSD